MARFAGNVGFAIQTEIRPGVFDDVITEELYFGDVVRASGIDANPDKVNMDLTVDNSISIVADAFANENFYAIRYVKWNGARWTVTSVDVRAPRLLLSLGEVYLGPAANDS